MQLTYTIHSYNWGWQWEHPLIQSHKRKLYHHDNCNHEQYWHMNNVHDSGCCISSESKISKWDDFWMFSSFSLLFFTSCDLSPVQIASAGVFTACQNRWSFPMHWIHQNVAIALYRLVGEHMGSYDCICRIIVSFFVSLSFNLLILALAAQVVYTKREIM